MNAAFIEAWVFASISSQGSALRDVLGIADFINRTAMTRDELELGVSRLLARNLIEVRGSVFSVTEPGMELRKRYGALLSFSVVKQLASEFAANPVPDQVSWKVDPEWFEYSWNLYEQEFDAIVKEDMKKLEQELREDGTIQ